MCLGCYAKLTRHAVCCFVSPVHPQQAQCSWAFPPPLPPARGLLMFVPTAQIHLSATAQAGQPAFLLGLETWQMDPTWVGFYCSQPRHNWGCWAICSRGVEMETLLLLEAVRPWQSLKYVKCYAWHISWHGWWASCSGIPLALSPADTSWSESSGLGISEYSGLQARTWESFT